MIYILIVIYRLCVSANETFRMLRLCRLLIFHHCAKQLDECICKTKSTRIVTIDCIWAIRDTVNGPRHKNLLNMTHKDNKCNVLPMCQPFARAHDQCARRLYAAQFVFAILVDIRDSASCLILEHILSWILKKSRSTWWCPREPGLYMNYNRIIC